MSHNDLETDPETDLETDLDQAGDAEIEPRPPGIDRELGVDCDTDLATTTVPAPDLDSSLDSSLDSDLDPFLLDSEGYLEVDPDVDPEVDSELDLGYIMPRAQVYLKALNDRVLVILPPPLDRLDSVAELTWQEIRQQLSQRLNAGERFWMPEARVTLIVGDRLLDNPQLQDLEETLADNDLALSRVQTNRRETAIAAVTAGYSVDQQALRPHAASDQTADAVDRANGTTIESTPSPFALAEPLYMRTTVRSGVEVRHPGSVIVFGDVNPGGSIIADGDIIVWGKLRGLVHAGANGNGQAIVAALQMEPTQIRITDTVARVPSQNPDRFYPEVAYVTRQGIRISRAEDFPRQAARLGLG